MNNKKAKLNNKLIGNKNRKNNPKNLPLKVKPLKIKPEESVKSQENIKDEKEKALKKYKTILEKNKRITKKKKIEQKKEKIEKTKTIIEKQPVKKASVIYSVKDKIVLLIDDVVKKVKRIKKKTRRLVIASLFILAASIITLIIFYNSPARISLVYDEFYLGDTVSLDDGSIWYVIEDSSSRNPNVKLLKDKPIDIDEDGNINENDRMAFDKDGQFEFDNSSESNIAYYLNKEYKERVSKLGSIKSVDLLTSEQYIKLRNALGLGYEWDEPNWLASTEVGYWWLETSRNKSVYTVNTKGSYVLYKPTRTSFVRPVITKDKSSIEPLITLVNKK